MGYYYDGKYENTLTFNNNNGTIPNEYFYKKGIEIVNNEEIIFDFSDFIQVENIGNILTEKSTPENVKVINSEKTKPMLLETTGFAVEDCLYQITINYKDGHKEKAIRPHNGNKDWLIIKHKFTFNNEDYFNLSSDISTWPTIDINIFNLYGISDTIKVPFRLRKASYTQSGIKLKLISANLRNDGKVSYVFSDVNNKQIILANNID